MPIVAMESERPRLQRLWKRKWMRSLESLVAPLIITCALMHLADWTLRPAVRCDI
jgi:hypothetical protein